MADDNTNAGSGGFDDWLEAKPGPATDPYKDLAEDDADEIADWMAFTESTAPPDKQEGESSTEPAPAASEVEVSDEGAVSTGELKAPADGQDPVARGAVDDEAETVEIDAMVEVAAAGGDTAAPFDFMAAEDDEHDVPPLDGPPATQPQEMPAPEAQGVGTQESGLDDADYLDEDDDTGDLEVIAVPPYGGYSRDTEGVPPESRELFDLSESDYVATATTEHSDLAEAVSAASALDTEQVPISAPIPGMADSIVGFEDVVEAEGIGRVRARASGDLLVRVITAVVLILALAASLIWRPVLAVFAVTVFVLGAGEFYTSLVRSDRQPIGLFGFAGIVGASAGAFFWGSLAIPAAFFVATAMLLLFYAVVPGKRDPLANLALTITVMVWVGLGAYAMLIAVSDDYRPLIVGVVVTVAAMDIAQYFVGRAIGRTKLSPWVSPKKTVEGLVAGIIVAMVCGALLHFVEPFELTSGLVLGAAVAVLSPIGDLSMSAAKRSLGLKDMGSVLPGHGGFLDRIDGLLFVIPAAWVIFAWAGLL